MTPLKKTFQYGNHTVTFETGEIARLLNGIAPSSSLWSTVKNLDAAIDG